MLAPRACANGITDPEAVPAYLLEAAAGVMPRTTDCTHRIRLAAFETLRGLVEPIGLPGLTSDNRSSRTAFNSDL